MTAGPGVFPGPAVFLYAWCVNLAEERQVGDAVVSRF